uniref:DDE Tnp4 domain-containing protein n=1 Tax=Ditylenchus dipsaci TaxID=166011 RepID=A0A915E965_9BILA
MEDLELLNAIGWWAMRKRRSYVRPAHYQSALHHNSFAAFWRYYNSPDEGDLKLFLRLSQTEFEAVYSLVRHQLEAHCPTHLRPIEGKERLAVFISIWSNLQCSGSSVCDRDSTVHDICKEVSEAIVTAMRTKYLPTPTRQTWERSARDSIDSDSSEDFGGYRRETHCHRET